MAFLKPNVLIPVQYYFNAAPDNITDVSLGYMPMDVEVFYIDVRMYDANDTFDATTVTLEYDEDGGSDTVIDAISIAANGVLTQVDQDALTTSTIPADARILLTCSNPSTGADQAIQITFWVTPKNTQL